MEHKKATSLYDVLQLTSSATSQEVRQAYRRLVRQHHPDRQAGQPDDLCDGMALLNHAYEVLSDSHRRAEYDASLRPRLPVALPARAGLGLSQPQWRQLWQWGLPPLLMAMLAWLAYLAIAPRSAPMPMHDRGVAPLEFERGASPLKLAPSMRLSISPAARPDTLADATDTLPAHTAQGGRSAPSSRMRDTAH